MDIPSPGDSRGVTFVLDRARVTACIEKRHRYDTYVLRTGFQRFPPSSLTVSITVIFRLVERERRIPTLKARVCARQRRKSHRKALSFFRRTRNRFNLRASLGRYLSLPFLFCTFATRVIPIKNTLPDRYREEGGIHCLLYNCRQTKRLKSRARVSSLKKTLLDTCTWHKSRSSGQIQLIARYQMK